MESWDWLRRQPEGQFLERKSCYRRAGACAEPDIKQAVRSLAETLAAMANAEGGTVVLGIEDDGTVTGVPERYNIEEIGKQIKGYTRPTIVLRWSEAIIEQKRVWIFETDWSSEVHQLTDGRYLYRHNDQNLPFPAADIGAIKRARTQLLTEGEFMYDVSPEDLDSELIQFLAKRVGLPPSVESVLEHYRLAERRNGRWIVTLAGVLLFAKDPSRWHSRCGIDFAIWQGTERRTGEQFNIKKRLRLEGLPLPRLIREAYAMIETYLPERQSLVELFFEERLAYPTFAWQEALVNAVAHRDYRYRGLGIEIDLFDDRLEVRSPGELVEPVTLERLRRRERVHASRNPRIVRVLTDFGFMRERGEGIPRMFEAMESEGLKPPELSVEGGCFVVILKGTPIYSPETMRWLKQFERHHLNRNQLRLLAFAKEHHGRFTRRAYQNLTGVDPYTATQDIRALARKGVVRTVRPRARVYMVIEPSAGSAPPEEIKPLLPLLEQKGCITNADVRRRLGLSRIQAYRFLNQLVRWGLLEQIGKGRGACYRLTREMHHSWHE